MGEFPEGREQEFQCRYAAYSAAVLGYALRRTERPEDAADVLWGYADQVAAGTVPRGYRQGLGCPS